MKYRAHLYAVAGVVWVLIPFIAEAALVPCGQGSTNNVSVGIGGSLSCDLCSLGELVQNIINFLLGLSVPIAAGLFAWAGILYFSSRGVPSQIEQAHKIFRSVVIGFVIAIAAWTIVQAVVTTLFNKSLFTGGSWSTLNCAQQRQARALQVNRSLTDVLRGLPAVGPSISTDYSNFYNTSGDIPYAGANSTVSPGYQCGTGYSLDNGTGYTDDSGKDVNTVSCVKLDARGDVVDEVAPHCQIGYAMSDGISDPGENGYRGLCVNQDSGHVEPVPLTLYGSGTGSSGTGGNSGVGTQQWKDQLQQSCAQNNLNDCALAQAIMANESGGRPGVISPAGAVGLMQVLPTTACSLQSMSGCETCTSRADNTNGNCSVVRQTLLDPTINMQYGTLELARLSQSSRTGGDPGLVAAAYNGGLGAVYNSRSCDSQLVYQCAANAGYAETRKYVPNVLGTYNTLKR